MAPRVDVRAPHRRIQVAEDGQVRAGSRIAAQPLLRAGRVRAALDAAVARQIAQQRVVGPRQGERRRGSAARRETPGSPHPDAVDGRRAAAFPLHVDRTFVQRHLHLVHPAVPSGRVRAARQRRGHLGARRPRERGGRDPRRRIGRDVPAMRMRGVDARSVRTERVVHGARERPGLVRRNVDVRGVEQHEIGDVGAQMDRVGAQPESASSVRAAIHERRQRGHRQVGARGRSRVTERAEGERFERFVGRLLRGVPGPDEEPVEPVEVEPRHERLRRIRIPGARGGGAEQPRHQQDDLDRRSAPHVASTRFDGACAQRVAPRRRQHQWIPPFAHP